MKPLTHLLFLFALLFTACASGPGTTSFLDPLSADDIKALSKDYPSYTKHYDAVNAMRDYVCKNALIDDYQALTYGELLDYLDTFTDTEYAQKIIQLASEEHGEKVYAPYVEKLDSTINEWREYKREHTPGNYLRVTPKVNRYTTESRTYGTIYVQELSYDIDYPRGDAEPQVVDCNLRCQYHDIYGEQMGDQAVFFYDLEWLKTKKQVFRGMGSKTVYEEHELLSVTLSDGSVITPEDFENNAPYYVRQYIDSDAKGDEAYTLEGMIIKELIDSNFTPIYDYTFQALERAYKDACPLAHKLVNNFIVEHPDVITPAAHEYYIEPFPVITPEGDFDPTASYDEEEEYDEEEYTD